jgi:hypothetical protein
MRTVQDVEAYLEKMNRRFSHVAEEERTFLVHGAANMPPIVLRVEAPLVVLRVRVGIVEGDAAQNGSLFEKLLTLNAKSLVHVSFGVEENNIVLCSALELENLDYNELAAVLDEMDMTLAQHVASLVELSKAARSLGSVPPSKRNS